ncbi:hypothetical protein CYMTET_15924 [Cymbomonas tetramitiformis]|uniref:RNA helicase n=1 Tax=Cymbomonas tetramitiformis TaxID=36881 RepID=A0AAE0GD84_9CHLO|nr:hypothetical protein CYMTET_15924 [Cymbomonas tetramitiformis]
MADPTETAPSEVASFEDLSLNPCLSRAVSKLGYERPTSVQMQCIPLALEGKDVVARARTGSGKTAAYLLPVFHKILESTVPRGTFPRALILVPTRELCQQVRDEAVKILNGSGGTLRVEQLPPTGSKPAETRAVLGVRPDVLVATPGRFATCLKDKLLQPDSLQKALQMLVLDEADLLLSFGYEKDLNLIATQVPPGCQVMLLSATMPENVERLKQLVLHDPVVVEVDDEDGIGADDALASAAGGITDVDAGPAQLVKHFTLDVAKAQEKLLYLLGLLRLNLVQRKVIIFVNTVDTGFRVKLFLEHFGVRCVVLNSELPSNSRVHILQEFNRGLQQMTRGTS